MDNEEQRQFRLEVLKLTLETGSADQIQNPIEAAEKYLQWCLLPLDKLEAPAKVKPSKK